jgi:peptidoglycan/xylan/chitin deacetylase (PgdA/CDA1 family)
MVDHLAMSRRTPPPLALAYHGIAAAPLRQDPSGLFVRPRDLQRQIRRLKSWGYRLVRFSELAARVLEGRGEGHAALTFDDGPADNLHSLLPLLGAEGVPATVFLVSGWLGQRYPEATWARILTRAEARELSRAGVEIGSHTVSHPDLTSLGYADALDELATSKRDLEAIVRAPVEVAAYPYGRASEETVAACREAGYLAACRTSGEGSWKEPLNLPRQDMDNGCTLLGLRLKRDDLYEPLMRSRAGGLAPRLIRAVRLMTAR